MQLILTSCSLQIKTGPDASMSFLDTFVMPQHDFTLEITVYRKPTITDLYLQWDNHHTIFAKYSVISILFYRTIDVYSNKQILPQE